MDSTESIVMQLERDLLDPSVRNDRERLVRLIADDFQEVGAAGNSFGKDNVLARLPSESGVAFTASEMAAATLADNVILVTYVATRSHAGTTLRSKRSSLWVRNSIGWQMRYHQGTNSETSAA